MSRRDTIILAVLLNTGLLAILFVLAINPDEDSIIDHMDVSSLVVEAPKVELIKKTSPVVLALENKTDEVDNVLKDFAKTIYSAPSESHSVGYVHESELPAAKPHVSIPIVKNSAPSNQVDYVEVTVKSGDILGRIAQANNTTVSAIKRINSLASDRLKVGQVLKIPLGNKYQKNSIGFAKETLHHDEELSNFYTIQSGDTPWKIAKRFSVSVQELLLLNELDENRARNLKPGDRIRVQ